MAKNFFDVASELENVFICDMTLEEARELVGTEGNTDEFDDALDRAQGEVSMQKADTTFVVIRIR